MNTTGLKLVFEMSLLAGLVLLPFASIAKTKEKVKSVDETPQDVDVFTALIPQVGGGIQWEVMDRFRLLKEHGASEVMFSRYLAYEQQVDSQIETNGPVATYSATHWDWRRKDFDPEYLKVKSLPIRVRAPFEGDCTWVVDGRKPTLGACAYFEISSCNITTGCSVQVTSHEQTPIIETIHPRHLIVATLGDSYASGEGVPDIRNEFSARDLNPKHTKSFWLDRKCHRSLYSGHALAALTYTMLDAHAAVSYVSYACSGALLRDGLIGSYSGAEPVIPGSVSSQLDLLTHILDGRRADFLTFSFGGNDVGFAEIVKATFLGRRAPLDKLFVAVPDKIAELDSLVTKYVPQLVALSANVLVMDYPTPTVFGRDGEYSNLARVDAAIRGDQCQADWRTGERFVPRVLARFLRFFRLGVDAAKLKQLETQVATPLREFVKSVAKKLTDGGATVDFVPLDEEFRLHGYCAPVLTPEDSGRWINTALDSFRLEGFLNVSGAMHPNIRGQDAIAKGILTKILEKQCAALKGDSLMGKICDEGSVW